MDAVRTEKRGEVTIVTLDRAHAKNAVDGPTARALADAFMQFDRDDGAKVAVFHGANGTFCAGADLKAVSGAGEMNPVTTPTTGMDFDRYDTGPMGPSRFVLSKPVIGAISGYAVAGGLELALWCDLRVVEEDAIFGVFCRRWGGPLIDCATVRLRLLIGHSRAMDMILTGRAVSAQEALSFGLANRVVGKGDALKAALELAEQISQFPQICMRHDRMSAIEQWDLSYEQAMVNEINHGWNALKAGEAREGATRFAGGKGRGGSFDNL